MKFKLFYFSYSFIYEIMTFAYMSHVYFSYNFLARHSNVLFSEYKEYQISSDELDLVNSYNRKKITWKRFKKMYRVTKIEIFIRL